MVSAFFRCSHRGGSTKPPFSLLKIVLMESFVNTSERDLEGSFVPQLGLGHLLHDGSANSSHKFDFLCHMDLVFLPTMLFAWTTCYTF